MIGRLVIVSYYAGDIKAGHFEVPRFFGAALQAEIVVLRRQFAMMHSKRSPNRIYLAFAACMAAGMLS